MLKQWLLHPLASWQEQKRHRTAQTLRHLRSRYHTFRALLEDNNYAVALLTDAGMKLRHVGIDRTVKEKVRNLLDVTGQLVDKIEQLGSTEGARLASLHHRLCESINQLISEPESPKAVESVVELDSITAETRNLVGSKAVELARLRRTGRFRVPAGFVIPLPSCRLFLEQDNLNLKINVLLQPCLGDSGVEMKDGVEQEVKKLILDTPLPPSLHQAMSEAAGRFLNGTGRKGLAVRSSALGEDGISLSFAGQYETVLNVVSFAGLEKGFKEVIASSFSRRNLSYRLHAGLDPLDFDLAVLCMEMVQAGSAGTLFTRDPNDPSSGRMLVSGVYGLGELAVAGSVMPDVYRPDRDSGRDSEPDISCKERRLVCSDTGGVFEEEVPEPDREKPVLRPDQLKTLCRWGLAVEKMENSPQDIEWAVTADGEPVLLQARPFRPAKRSAATGKSAAYNDKPLLAGGVSASSGEGVGRVWIVKNRSDLGGQPDEPYVLVMHQSLVDAVPALRGASGIVIDFGNPLDHLSCVAREYNIPMLTGLGNAVERLQEYDWILVDADHGQVWQARDEDITEAVAMAKSRPARKELDQIPDDPKAADLYHHIVPLNLTDAYGPTFSISECKTLHDLIRYIHEKAVIIMFEMGDEALEQSTDAVHHLETEVPFAISIIDLGGGLVQQVRPGRWVRPSDIASLPLNALWSGIADPTVEWGPPAGGVAMDRVMSRFLTDHKSARPVGLPNYAIITRDYLNLNARMDFHFIMIDSICGIDSRSNYIRFRFKGGGTTARQRRRRAQCIEEILVASGFACDVRDDLVTADLTGADRQTLEDRLGVLGRLLGFTRLLDAAMRSDEAPKVAARAFLSGNYHIAAELLETEAVD